MPSDIYIERYSAGRYSADIVRYSAVLCANLLTALVLHTPVLFPV